MTIPDEAALWNRARDGDPDAFGEVFDLHHARVFRQSRRISDSLHDAEDLTALVFLEAWRRRESVRIVDGSIIAWLTVTANNLAHNARRSRRRGDALIRRLHTSDRSSAIADDHADAVDERIDRTALAVRTVTALRRLPDRDRDVIALCVIQGLSIGDASELLGVAPGTVKSRLSRARRRLSADVLTSLTTSSAGGAR